MSPIPKIPTWDELQLKVAEVYASKSKDRSTQMGCVIVGPDNEPRSAGYNNFPRGIDDTVEERHQRPQKYLWTEHAERNAIYNAARIGVPLKGCRIFVQSYPCADCARGIIQSGIIEVVTNAKPMDSRWNENHEVALKMFEEAGVTVRVV